MGDARLAQNAHLLTAYKNLQSKSMSRKSTNRALISIKPDTAVMVSDASTYMTRCFCMIGMILPNSTQIHCMSILQIKSNLFILSVTDWLRFAQSQSSTPGSKSSNIESLPQLDSNKQLIDFNVVSVEHRSPCRLAILFCLILVLSNKSARSPLQHKTFSNR